MNDNGNIQAKQVRPPEYIVAALTLLGESVKAGRGREFDAQSLFGIATFIAELQKANAQAMVAIEGMDQIIMRYVGVHGEELMQELFEEEGMYVNAEVVAEGEWDNEGGGPNAPPQVDEEVLEDTGSVRLRGVEAE